MTLTSEKKRRLILVIAMGFMVLVVSYYFGFRWISEARAKTAQKEVTLTEQAEKMKKTIEEGKIADKKLEVIEIKLKPVNDQMPPEQAETWLARAMDTVATRHSLKLKGSRLADPDPAVLDEAKTFKHFGIVGYAFNVQGTYFKLGEFLADLEGAHPLMVIESMNIQAGAGGATNIHEMSLKVDMVTRKE
jgi:Tfp pilus assembly protein PilO